MKNKKGSHFSIIISIVLFVTFLTFVFVFLGPTFSVQKDNNLAMEHLNVELTNLMSSDLTLISFSIPEGYSPGVNSDCLRIGHPGNYTLNYTLKDINGVVLTPSSAGSDLAFDWTNRSNKLFKASYIEGTLETNSAIYFACYDPTETIESITVDKKIIESKVEDVILIYEENYEDFKESLNIPFNSEFNFNFTYDDGTSISPSIEINSPEIYIKEFVVEYVDKEANINVGKLAISVW
jgi:hypothetical protein